MVTTSLPRIGQFVMGDLWPSDDHSLVGLEASLGFLAFDSTCGGRRRLLACACPQFRPTIVTASTQLLWELKVHVCASCCARLDRA